MKQTRKSHDGLILGYCRSECKLLIAQIFPRENFKTFREIRGRGFTKLEGRKGGKCPCTGKRGCTFMRLNVVKYGGQLEFLAR